jgi:hypothetical protein
LRSKDSAIGRRKRAEDDAYKQSRQGRQNVLLNKYLR